MMAAAPAWPTRRHRLAAGEEARLRPAADDFRFLLGRGYPSQASLTLVGNRYHLSWAGRQILLRGVCDPVLAAQRRGKICPVPALAGRTLALDGHNVLITLECALQGIPVLAADDGFIRDIGQVSQSHVPSPLTDTALWLLCRYLDRYNVGPVQVWYDAPMSGSGELAATTRRIFQACQVVGDAQTARSPEAKLLESGEVIASSDSYLIDRAAAVADLAGEIIRQLPWVQILTLGAQSEPPNGQPGD